MFMHCSCVYKLFMYNDQALMHYLRVDAMFEFDAKFGSLRNVWMLMQYLGFYAGFGCLYSKDCFWPRLAKQ